METREKRGNEGERRGKLNGNAKRELDCQRALFSDRIKTEKIVSYRAPGAGRRFLSRLFFVPSFLPIQYTRGHRSKDHRYSVFDLDSKCYETSHVASASNVSRLKRRSRFFR